MDASPRKIANQVAKKPDPGPGRIPAQARAPGQGPGLRAQGPGPRAPGLGPWARGLKVRDREFHICGQCRARNKRGTP